MQLTGGYLFARLHQTAVKAANSMEVFMTSLSHLSRRSLVAAFAATLFPALAFGADKALEFLNAGSIDFGSTAGSAALVAKINGNPIKSIYVYSRPEWTALVTGKDSKIARIEDLKGKRVAVTRGTDPHIFLVRSLQSVGLSEKDITPVLLQHADGKTALTRGDVDAWAGLDPMMAQAEVEDGARLFYRNKGAN